MKKGTMDNLRRMILGAFEVPTLTRAPGGIRVQGWWCEHPEGEASADRFDRVYPVEAVVEAISTAETNGVMEYGTHALALLGTLDKWFATVTELESLEKEGVDQ